MSDLEYRLFNALGELKAVCVTVLYRGNKDNGREEIIMALYNARVLISNVIERIKEQEKGKSQTKQDDEDYEERKMGDKL